MSTVRSVINAAHEENEALSLFAGGNSMSGRVFSMAQANASIENLAGISPFIAKPSTELAKHLKNINLPMLFLSGQRNKMASLDLLEPVVRNLSTSRIHVVDTANRGFKVLERRK